MDENTGNTVEKLAHEALNVPAENREEFLTTACHGDVALRQEIDLLLERIESLVDQAIARPANERNGFLKELCQGNSFVCREAGALLDERTKAGLSPDQITSLLLRLSQGDKSALDSLAPLVYDDLRRLAYYLLRSERPNHTLQPTALVNEMYIKFMRQQKLEWQNRAHFIAIAARAMRQILIDYAKRRKRDKNGGGYTFLSPEEAFGFAVAERPMDVLALDEALKRLALVHARKEQVVELRYFGGLTNDEIAEVLQIAPNTVTLDWDFAKAWLNREMTRKEKNGIGTTEEA